MAEVLLPVHEVVTRGPIRDVEEFQQTIADTHWQRVTKERWPNTLPQAATIAGSYKRYFAEKVASERENSPWTVLCNSEKLAIVRNMVQHGPNVVFMLDTSGSVTEEDFAAGTAFIKEAVAEMRLLVPQLQVGVLQFSNEARVEYELSAPESSESFHNAVDSLVRMNGGTNIAACFQKAGSMVKELGPNVPKTLCLLTDGRVDSFQVREAMDIVKCLGDEMKPLHLYALGIGRGVDDRQLELLVKASNKELKENRYFGLRVMDQGLW